jgi:hypothetical protein
MDWEELGEDSSAEKISAGRTYACPAVAEFEVLVRI